MKKGTVPFFLKMYTPYFTFFTFLMNKAKEEMDFVEDISYNI